MGQYFDACKIVQRVQHKMKVNPCGVGRCFVRKEASDSHAAKHKGGGRTSQGPVGQGWVGCMSVRPMMVYQKHVSFIFSVTWEIRETELSR